MVKFKFIFSIFVALAVTGVFFAPSASAWVNLYNDFNNQHSALEWDWDFSGNTHTLTVWNDGSTNEDFINTISVLNIVRSGTSVLSWDETNNYFTDYQGTIIELSGYDGIFDNSNAQVDNMSVGKWPYFEYGDLTISGNQVSNSFDIYGAWSGLETDEIAEELRAVPEPGTFMLMSLGLLPVLFPFFGSFRKKIH